jgi:hypothetical protein
MSTSWPYHGGSLKDLQFYKCNSYSILHSLCLQPVQQTGNLYVFALNQVLTTNGLQTSQLLRNIHRFHTECELTSFMSADFSYHRRRRYSTIPNARQVAVPPGVRCRSDAGGRYLGRQLRRADVSRR